MLSGFHTTWAYLAVAICGLTGLWGVGLRLVGRPPGRTFRIGVAVAIAAILLQGGAGLALFAQGSRPGSFHVFYGIVIFVTLVFAYIYRAQLARRPALSWGLLLLFVMGLGVRAITTFGEGVG